MTSPFLTYIWGLNCWHRAWIADTTNFSMFHWVTAHTYLHVFKFFSIHKIFSCIFNSFQSHTVKTTLGEQSYTAFSYEQLFETIVHYMKQLFYHQKYSINGRFNLLGNLSLLPENAYAYPKWCPDYARHQEVLSCFDVPLYAQSLYLHADKLFSIWHSILSITECQSRTADQVISNVVNVHGVCSAYQGEWTHEHCSRLLVVELPSGPPSVLIRREECMITQLQTADINIAHSHLLHGEPASICLRCG